jgi:ATP-dependent Clp protease ATP-binding subunit ClpB
VLFKPLTEPEIERIVELMLDDLRSRLAPGRITLEVTEAARQFIAHEVETRIGRALLGNEVLDGATTRVHLRHGALEVQCQNPDEPAKEAA